MARDHGFNPQSPLPANSPDLIQDLELTTLLNAMASGDRYIFDVCKTAVLSGSNNQKTIRYRQDVLKDCLKNPEIVRKLYKIPIESIQNKNRRWLGIYSTFPSGILSGSVEMMQMFVDLLKRLKTLADEYAGQFESEGFRTFFAMINLELADDYFAHIQEHLKALKFEDGVLISAELGQGNEGINYVLRKPNGKKQNWVKRMITQRASVYTFRIDPHDDAGGKALAEARNRGINLVANAVAQSADHIDNFLEMLRLELAFYIGCLNLHDRLTQIGESVSFPRPVAAAERSHEFQGLYDVCLALTMKQKIVGNDLNAQNKDLVLITGANQGGKSTFLRSIGLAQLMMQCGMFVAATSFSANLCTGLFTHYRRKEDASMESGKLDEELSRMSDIVDRIAPNAMILFNESFAATNEREGSEIARQITCALLDERIKVFFVTHLYTFAHNLNDRKMANAIFLRAGREPNGNRTFKLAEGQPLQTSYGEDVYQEVFHD